MIKRCLLFLVFTIFLDNITNAQTWQWIRSINNTPRWSEADHMGCHVIMAISGNNHLISKFDPFGNMLWQKMIIPVVSTSTPIEDVRSLTVDRYGNIYFVAKPIASINDMPVNSPGPFALIKVDPMGRYIWAKQIDFSASFNLINTAHDTNGIFLAISFNQGTSLTYQGQTFASFGPVISTTAMMSLDTAGNIRWANRLASYGPNNPCASANSFPYVSVNNRNEILLQGQTAKTLQYGSDILLNRANCQLGLYAALLNSNDGSVKWVKELDLDSLAPVSGYNLIHDKILSAVLPDGNSLVYSFSTNLRIVSGSTQYFNVLSKFYLYDEAGNLVADKLLPSATNNFYRLTGRLKFNKEGEVYTQGIYRFIQTLSRERFEIRKFNAALDTIWTRRIVYNASTEDFEGWQFSYTNNSLFSVIQNSGVNNLNYAYFGADSLRPSLNNLYQVKMIDRIPDSVNSIYGKVFFDLIPNGIFQAGEKLLPGVLIGQNNPAVVYGATANDGKYMFTTDTGTYNFRPVNIAEAYPNYTLSVPAQRTAVQNTYGYALLHQDFAMQAPASITDGEISITPFFIPRPGMQLVTKVLVKNIGTISFNGSYNIGYDTSKLEFVSSSIPPVSSTPTSRNFDFSSLAPLDTVWNDIYFNVKTTVQAGDSIKCYAYLQTSPIDGSLPNNTDSVIMISRTSYDPNEKEVYPFRHINYDQTISGNTKLDYKLYFQNTGTDTAFMVSIKDTLDENLDLRTFKLVSSSHPVNVIWHGSNIIEFYFPGVKLPHQAVNEIGSHGFARFTIKPKNTIQLTDTIHNSCSIYFDYNSPVKTNTVENYFPLTVVPLKLLLFDGSLRESSVELYWKTENEINTNRFELESSADAVHFTTLATLQTYNNSGINNYNYTDRNVAHPLIYYRLKLIDNDGSYSYSEVISFKMNNVSRLSFKVISQSQNNLQLQINSGGNTNGILQLYDAAGRVMYTNRVSLQTGINNISIENLQLAKGAYTIVVNTLAGTVSTQVFLR